MWQLSIERDISAAEVLQTQGVRGLNLTTGLPSPGFQSEGVPTKSGLKIREDFNLSGNAEGC